VVFLSALVATSTLRAISRSTAQAKFPHNQSGNPLKACVQPALAALVRPLAATHRPPVALRNAAEFRTK
jgi:hypothetical protein